MIVNTTEEFILFMVFVGVVIFLKKAYFIYLHNKSNNNNNSTYFSVLQKVFVDNWIYVPLFALGCSLWLSVAELIAYIKNFSL